MQKVGILTNKKEYITQFLIENICRIGGNSGQKQIGEFISGPRINIRHARASYRAHAHRDLLHRFFDE